MLAQCVKPFSFACRAPNVPGLFAVRRSATRSGTGAIGKADAQRSNSPALRGFIAQHALDFWAGLRSR